MKINDNYAKPILVILNVLAGMGVPCQLYPIWDGLQIRFPWGGGDIVCHGFSYGHDRGCVESMGCPWDEDDVTCLTVEEATIKVVDWYKTLVEKEGE